MTDYSFALQTALYQALTSPVISGVQSVRDTPNTTPSPEDFPFIHIGETQAVPDDADKSGSGGDEGSSEFVELHVWSRYRGQREAKLIVAEIHTRLHQAALTVPGRVSALCWVRNKQVFTDTDGMTQHGIASLEIIHRS
ncbi:MAG: DUF3168 domain-containing protein [Pseudomonadota bacterium]